MRRARMPALSRPALFRTALAAALAAITIPFIAHAASGDESVTAPVAQVFPTRQGIGVTWTPVDASGYRVERKQTTDWQDVSGVLADSATTWIDESIAPGTTAEYRVVAQTSDTTPATSPPVTATRVTEAPAVGDIDALALHANRGEGVTWLQDETASQVTASGPTDGSRTLSAGALKVKLPAFIAGPGRYELPQAAVAVTQGDRTCSTAAELRVDAVSYTHDLQLETFAASLVFWSCAGSAITAGAELRFRSAIGYQFLSVTPDKLDAGRVKVGTVEDLTVTLKSTGTEAVKFENISLAIGTGSHWTLRDRTCGTSLPAGAACTLTIRFQPNEGRADYWAQLWIRDSTVVKRHNVQMVGTGTSLPKAPQVFNVTPTYRGLSLSWQTWKSAGGTPVRGYFVHRYLDGQETTQFVEPGQFPAEWISITDTAPKPGTEYALSVVNEIGDGPVGPRVKPARPTQQLALVGLRQGETRELTAASLGGYVVPFAVGPDSVRPKDTVTTAPDGRSLAYVTSKSDHVLWSQAVTPSEVGVPVELWSSPVAITHLSWSPDGARIAFQAPDNGTPCVYVIAATGGTPEKIACDLTSPSWMPDARTLVVVDRRFDGDDRFARIYATAGGNRVATLPAAAATADGQPVRVSPDGRWVAFGSGSLVKMVDFTSTKVLSSPSLGSPVRSLSWDPDGGPLLALGVGQMFRLYPDRLDWSPIELTADYAGGGVSDLAWQRLGLTIAPLPAVVGHQASIAFDASALLPGTTFTCSVRSTTTACTSPYAATNLSQGENDVVITATEPDGRVTKAYRTITADVSGPVARVTGPAYQSAVAPTAKVSVAATDASGVASYDVRYRRASFAGAYSGYIHPWTNVTATSMDLSVAAGYEYCVSVRAKDKLGNVGQWSAERCFSRPLDDRSLAMATSGWARATGSAFYFGTTTQTTGYGKALSRTVQGKRFFLVATRCPTCGSVAVYAGSKYLTTINLAYPTTHRQVVLGLPVQSTLFSGTLTFSTRSTGKLVQIDGLAVGRT